MFRKRLSRQILAILLSSAMLILQGPAPLAEEPFPSPGETLIEESEPEEAQEEDLLTEEDIPEEESSLIEEEPAAEKDIPSPEENLSEEAFFTAFSEEDPAVREGLAEHDVLSELAVLSEGEDYAVSEVILSAPDEEYARKAAESYGGKLVSCNLGVAVIDLSGSPFTVEEAVRAGLNPESGLPAVEPNYLISLEEPVSDHEDTAGSEDSVSEEALYAGPAANPWQKTWSDIYPDLANPDRYLNPEEGTKYQWYHDLIHTWAGWGARSDAAVKHPLYTPTVAVIDTGVRADHEELSGRVTSATVKHNSEDLRDTDISGHGTHVAGIIAASSNNGVGGAGICPGCNLLSICVLYKYTKDGKEKTDMPTDSLVQAVNYVTNGGAIRADIINMSLGGPSYSSLLQQAITNAHDAGITVIASMGNDFANCRKYPAAYDNVIAVASVNEKGARSVFSSYGSWADIAAPGDNIYSTYYSLPDSYREMDGTSMSTPMVSGACALYMSTKGAHVDPDTMENLLKKSARKVSASGIGAGILDVSALLAEFIEPPEDAVGITITNVPGAVKAGTSYTFKASVDPVSESKKIRWSVTGASGVSINEKTGKLTASKSASGTATVRCTSTTVDTCHTEITVPIANAPVPVESITVTGQQSIAPGASATYKALVLPSNADNKKVTFRLSMAGKTPEELNNLGVSISSKGKVTVKKGASSFFTADDVFTVTALSADETVTGQTVFSIRPKASSVSLFTAATSSAYKLKLNRSGSLTSLQLYTTDLNTTAVAEDSILLTAAPVGAAPGSTVRWSSSNENVVTVTADPLNPNKATLRQKGKGKAVITAATQDGSKKKATLKVNVIVPVSDLNLYVKDQQRYYIGYGKSISLGTAFSDAYGTPTNKKVTWDYEVVRAYYHSSGSWTFEDIPSASLRSTLKGLNLFKISKSGKVKVVKNFLSKTYSYSGNLGGADEFGVRVIAKTTDGTEKQAVAEFVPMWPTTKLYCTGYSGRKTSNYLVKLSIFNGLDESKRSLSIPIETNASGTLAVKSSNPDILSASATGDTLYLDFPPVDKEKTGTVKVTIRATDGSGKKCTIRIRVKKK